MLIIDSFDLTSEEVTQLIPQVKVDRYVSGMNSYKDIQKQYCGRAISYDVLLNTTEWVLRSKPILVRDGNRCQGKSCASRCSGLQVHHRYYVLSKLPWDYPDDALLTLCQVCHVELHRTQQVPVYEEMDGKLVKRSLRPCIRCLGAGWFPQWTHIEEGVCFKCRGAMFTQEVVVAHVPRPS
jgi:hypothetical protein